MVKVYISFSADIVKQVKTLVKFLNYYQIETWINYENICKVTKTEERAEAMMTSNLILLCISHGSAYCDVMMNDVNYALKELKKPMIVLNFDAVQIPQLKGIGYLISRKAQKKMYYDDDDDDDFYNRNIEDILKSNIGTNLIQEIKFLGK